MTLLELTIVILVLLGLISVLFMGARAWKRGSDRAMCLTNIQMFQKAVRGYSNMYGHNAGDNVVSLQDKLVGAGTFFEHEPVCPGGGTYIFGGTFGQDTIPPMGELYLNCSYGATHGHQPAASTDW